jgi:spore coat polysaccharide biosynthesis predicted glycosyltransferase SpsG
MRVILGLGYAHNLDMPNGDGVTVLRAVSNMAVQMRRADIVFTSAGRTTFEVACVGTPAVVITQNQRESTHLFATPANGFVNLGPADDVSEGQIQATFLRLIEDPAERDSMQRRMTEVDLNGGLERVRQLIEGLVLA